MKKLDYASLFISMVSLVWMLTLLLEVPAADVEVAQEAASSRTEVVAVTGTSPQTASRESDKATKGHGLNSLLTL